MNEIKAQEDVLVSDISRLSGKLENYLDCIMKSDNTGEQAASIPELTRLLYDMYQTGEFVETVETTGNPNPMGFQSQAVIFKQNSNKKYR